MRETEEFSDVHMAFISERTASAWDSNENSKFGLNTGF